MMVMLTLNDRRCQTRDPEMEQLVLWYHRGYRTRLHHHGHTLGPAHCNASVTGRMDVPLAIIVLRGNPIDPTLPIQPVEVKEFDRQAGTDW